MTGEVKKKSLIHVARKLGTFGDGFSDFSPRWPLLHPHSPLAQIPRTASSLIHTALTRLASSHRHASTRRILSLSPKWIRLRAIFSLLVGIVVAGFLIPAFVSASESGRMKINFFGYLKTFNFLTRTSGLTPELVDNPLAGAERGENIFNTTERVRLKPRANFEISDTQRVEAKIDYDHQVYFGNFVGSGDFRIARKQSEERQFLDLGETLVEDEDGFYEQRLYRASVLYHTEWFELEIGRQQIPWGVGHFFTPTDLFNPFSVTQLELDERDGVDAINVTSKRIKDFKIQGVYTPTGGQLHPQRYLGRISRDFNGYEFGLLGGRVKRDHAAGFDIAGNLDDSSVRGEFLYREADDEKDFVKFTVNADHNFPHNIHGLMEYHFNGQGRRDPNAYQIDRQIRGEILQLGKNYLALLLGHD
ncbi:MAG: hypothetical protein NC930_02960, partial [Candidatus Omnitrophica bacterium]|nr:hypothetical protein [Candidatus Omnitrophota bacterium]